jgi:hypothetical protein
MDSNHRLNPIARVPTVEGSILGPTSTMRPTRSEPGVYGGASPQGRRRAAAPVATCFHGSKIEYCPLGSAQIAVHGPFSGTARADASFAARGIHGEGTHS